MKETNAWAAIGLLVAFLIIALIGIFIGNEMIAAVNLTDSDPIYSTEQVWVQQTAAAEWESRNFQNSVETADGNIILVGGRDSDGNNLNDTWLSTDNGITWSQQTAAAKWNSRYAQQTVALSDGSIVMMGGYWGTARRNDVWRSTDQGVSWVEQNPSAAWNARMLFSAVALPDDSIVIIGGQQFTGTSNDVWRSTDYGVTWAEQTAAAAWKARTSFGGVALSDGSIVMMGGQSAAPAAYHHDVWRSTDQGATWVQQTAAAAWNERELFSAVAMQDGSIIVTGGSGGSNDNETWRSADQGVTWTQILAGTAPDRDTHSTVALSDGSVLLMGGTNGGGYNNDTWRLYTYTTVTNPLADSQSGVVETFQLGVTLCKIIIIVTMASIIFLLLRRTGLLPKMDGDNEGGM